MCTVWWKKTPDVAVTLGIDIKISTVFKKISFTIFQLNHIYQAGSKHGKLSKTLVILLKAKLNEKILQVLTDDVIYFTIEIWV